MDSLRYQFVYKQKHAYNLISDNVFYYSCKQVDLFILIYVSFLPGQYQIFSLHSWVIAPLDEMVFKSTIMNLRIS